MHGVMIAIEYSYIATSWTEKLFQFMVQTRLVIAMTVTYVLLTTLEIISWSDGFMWLLQKSILCNHCLMI